MSDPSLDVGALLTAFLDGTRVVHVVRLAPDGTVVSANAAMCGRLGVADRALQGRPIFEYLTDHDAAIVGGWLAEGVPRPDPIHLNFCDADSLPFTLRCFASLDSGGCVLVGEPAYDDEQRLQRHLLETNEELANLARTRLRSTLEADRARLQAEADNRAKDDALAVIAHELRQPLSGVVAALGVMKQNPAGAARAQQILERQVGHMARLVEDLLHASQVMRGAIALQREPIDLRQMVREAADLAEAAVRNRQQQLTVETHDEPLPILADGSRIRQVLTNILTNATKYTPEGGSIAILADRTGNGAGRVRVRDTGQGIAAADLERVFDLFARAAGGGNGLGIGLAVARRLVELHDGTIAAHSEGTGRGSEFIVTLPMIEPA